METFSALLAFCAGNSPVPVNFPHKGQWRGALMFSLICARTNRWINNREAGDLRRHQAHYDVSVMKTNAIEEVTLMTELRTVRSLVSLVTLYPIKYAHVYVLFCCVVSWAPRDACHLLIYIVQDYLLFQNALEFLAATKQLYKWYFPSVRLSVRLSVTHFWLCSRHRIIMKFSGVITNDQRKVHAKGQGQRLKVKVTEVTTQLNRFRTVTPVWIHIWWWNDAYSLMLLRRGALLFFKVIRQISRLHGSKNRRIWPRLGVSGI